jgi:putative CocE/NonD family hydrolase
MRRLLTLILIWPAAQAFAQNFYFPPSSTSDSSAFAKNAPALAQQVIAAYRERNRATWFDNRFRLYMVSGQYRSALDNLDSARKEYMPSDTQMSKVIGIQYEIFSVAEMMHIQSGIPFNEAYDTAFQGLYNALSPKAAPNAYFYFDADLNKLRDDFFKLLNDRKGKDSIGLDDARQLCRTYNMYNVFAQSQSSAKAMLAALEKKSFIIDDSVLVTTRDDARLSLLVVRKKGVPEKLPAIFVFNIYNGPADQAMAKEAALHGYVGIVANTRGKRLSPQAIEPFEHDANDAYDIIDWISRQPWCNGKVGMFGGSYLGFAQWAAVKKVHPALKTIIPQVAVGIGVDYPMANNIFMSYMLQWIHYVTNSKQTDDADFDNQAHWDSVFKKWYVSGKPFRSLDTIEGRPNKIFQRWLTHPSHDTYWENMVADKSDFSRINIPVLTITGYFDDDQLGAMYYFRQHHLYNKNAVHYLLIGPYNHGGAQGYPGKVVRGYRIDSVANIPISELTYQWFNYILKDSARPAILQDNINYEVMGSNTWKHAPSLSRMTNDTLSFYLTDIRMAQHYKLDRELPETPEFIRQEVDLSDRSDTVETNYGNIIDSVYDPSNAISFISKPFEKSIEITGSFVGRLNVMINKRDMDVSIAMYEQMPDGKYFQLGSYITRASYSKDREHRQLFQPDKAESIPINNSIFTSRKISAGSRLLVTLSVIKSPQWQLNYGTGKDVSDETLADAKTPLQIRWYNSSMIKVPIYQSFRPN